MPQEQKSDPRKIEDLYRAFENADFIVRKRYRADLEKYPVCDLPEWIKDVIPGVDSASDSEAVYSIGDNVQFFKIEKLVYDRAENITDKLTTVYHTMSSFANTSVVMVLHSDGASVTIYMGVAERPSNEGKIDINSRGNKLATLETAFRANFPGSSVTGIISGRPIDKKQVIGSFSDGVQAISCVTGIASLRNKDSNENNQFVQGIEKLIDSMRGKTYSAVFIADCKGIAETEKLCADYEDIYSKLSPFAQSQQTIGKTDSENETQSLIDGVTDTTNESVSDALSHGHTIGNFSSNTSGGGVTAGGKAKIPFIAEGSLSASVNHSHTTGQSNSDSDTTTKTTTTGTAKSLTKQNSVAKSLSTSTSDGLQINMQNRAVKTLMDRIDEQIKHLRACEAYGVFDFSCYFLAQESAISLAAASIYDSLMRGDESGTEASSVNTWTEDNAEKMLEYLKRFYHPLIAIPDLSKPEVDNAGNQTGSYEVLPVTPSAMVSGKEIALHMGLPKRSVSGIPVTECVAFGREVVLHTADKPEGSDTIPLGNIYHMRTEEKNTPVNLQKDSLTAHTFITGSTGAGKSNAVYTMLNGLCPASNGDESKSHAHFLVIEPAKGEYKDVFGGRGDVSVYGTNPKKTPLLRLNPFSFPEDTHILEHIDRLVEVFNACWPMYAAMPAVLKASIETAYTDCGWDLQMSEYAGKQRNFPTFRDVMKALPKVVDTKGFSNDTQGDYKGALLTRLESLTNGINGQVLCAADEIAGQELFDKNVIVDLSRVGSSETKALLMGILVLKLQEYRMAERAENGAADNNKGLHHVTVLEEAHNLLRRTSSEQSQEGSNLQGKSVEMLTNAIAEMRTYGEGFIIADQAPGLLDMAVIRNTNTKIILRLPDESDRVLVGKAAGLNDDQIVELSRLDTGVAAVYQNHWLEPVLCKVTEFKKEQQKPFVYKPIDADTIQNSTSYMNVFFGRIVKTDPTIGELNAEDVDRLKNWIDNLPVGRNTKLQLLSVLNPEGKLEGLNKGEILYRLANGNDFLKYAGTKTDREAACTAIDQKIMQQLDISRQLAEEVRREIFLYAASQIDRERLAAQYDELQQYAELPQRGVR